MRSAAAVKRRLAIGCILSWCANRLVAGVRQDMHGIAFVTAQRRLGLPKEAAALHVPLRNMEYRTTFEFIAPLVGIIEATLSPIAKISI